MVGRMWYEYGQCKGKIEYPDSKSGLWKLLYDRLCQIQVSDEKKRRKVQGRIANEK